MKLWFLLVFCMTVKFLGIQATDNQEVVLVSTTQQPSKGSSFVKSEQSCAGQVQFLYLLEIIKLQNTQILNILEHKTNGENEVQNISTKQFLQITDQLYSEMNKVKEYTKQIMNDIEMLSRNPKSNTCNKKQSGETDLHIVSAIQNIVQEKIENQNSKLQEIKLFMSQANKSIQKILSYVEKLTNIQEHIREIYDEINSGSQNAQLELQTEESNKRLENIEREIIQTQQSLKKLRNTPRDCREIQNSGNNVSGVYYILPEFASESFPVLCDMETRQGGWIYIINRFDGSQNFYLNWTDYKLGFGKLTGEFWLGLEHLYELTGHKKNELLIELVDWDNKTVHAHYASFAIGREEESYPLKTLTGFSGDVQDSLSYHVNRNFSTVDHNNSTGGYCPGYFNSGWWFGECYTSHLTGKYLKGNLSTNAQTMGIHWNGFKHSNYSYSLKQARMMIRPHSGSVVRLPHKNVN